MLFLEGVCCKWSSSSMAQRLACLFVSFLSACKGHLCWMGSHSFRE